MQKQIILQLFHKINPFLKNFSVFFNYFSRCLPCGSLSSGKIDKIRPRFPSGESIDEIAQFVAPGRMGLCKPFVYISSMWKAVDSCGKPLWTTLWRMWKTHVFQQLFGPSSIVSGLWRFLHTRMYNSLAESRYNRLRQPAATAFSGEKPTGVFCFVGISPLCPQSPGVPSVKNL